MVRLVFVALVLFTALYAKAQENSLDQLIIFFDKTQPILTEEDKNAFKVLAQKANITLQYEDVSTGAPKEITYTPMILFQNHLGRSFYYGRYKNTSRLQNFIRTSRLAHQQQTENIKKDKLVWLNERAMVTASIKVTELKGTLPKKYSEEYFQKEMKNAIVSGMTTFLLQSEVAYQRTTRSFYADFHPYIDKKKNLSIGVAIFSQYNCVKPVFKQFKPALISGKWKNRAALFAQAGQQAEQLILEQIQSSELGDALRTVANSTPTVTWKSMGLVLPAPPKRQAIVEGAGDSPIPFNWTIAPTKNSNEPLVIFSFLPPVDSYAGEVKALNGTLQFDKGQLTAMNGSFTVQIADVTMGAEDFDYEVQNKMLNKNSFPTATFTFERVKAPNQQLQLGDVHDIMAFGNFKMLGKTIPLKVPASLETYYNTNGELRLRVNASFELPLYESFGVEGPDGPSPAKDTLQFFMKFYLEPLYTP